MFLKKFLLGIGAVFFILIGGAGTQSNSTLLQGSGFLGLIIGLVILYIFAKMAWRAMGCLPSLLVIITIIVFILFAIGAFKGGLGNIIPNIKSFIGYNAKNKKSENSMQLNILDEEDFDIQINENFSSEDKDNNTITQPDNQKEAKSLLQHIFGVNSGAKQQLNPRSFPAIYSNVKVSSADTLIINGRYFRLFGIDAPEINQTCSDYLKRPYQCGQEAASWLRSWLQDNEIECRVMQQDDKGNMVGVCFIGQYDIGAALVNAGWAVVYGKHSDIYIPYQNQARINSNGLWQGDFYMPWDWRKIQARKPQIKIINQRRKRRHTFF